MAVDKKTLDTIWKALRHALSVPTDPETDDVNILTGIRGARAKMQREGIDVEGLRTAEIFNGSVFQPEVYRERASA